MSIVDDIRATLDAKLASIAGLPPIAFENAPFKQQAGQSHLRVRFFLTSRRPAVRGPTPQHRYQGLYRIIVATPSETGSGAALGVADTLLDEFNGSTNVQGNPIVSIEYSELGSPFKDEPFYCIPVEIAWYVYD